jgi:hypothetical protein
MSSSVFLWPGTPRNAEPTVGYTPTDPDGLPATSAQHEVVVRVGYVDAYGQFQYAVTRTTAPLFDITHRAEFKRACEHFYSLVGARLVTLELGAETVRTIAGLRIPTRLHVIKCRPPVFG